MRSFAALMERSASVLSESEAPISTWMRLLRWRQTSKQEAVASEKGILGLLSNKWRVQDVPVSAASPEHYLHTTQGGQAEGPALVMMPGYGAGTGFFYRNLDGLARAFRVFAVDWLGTGLSGRPAFVGVDRPTTEDFFLESLNTWRRQQGLDRFILVGHSLGGYLAASYALRHPEQVQHLVLVCPAGIPPKPEDWESRFLSDSWSLRSQLFRLAGRAWASGFTPGSLIRALGPWGPGLVDKYVNGRFSMHGQPMSQKERDVFRDYFYHIAAARGSGEYALRHILAPGAWAHEPLHDRLLELDSRVPVTFIYGEHDWMNPAAGKALAKELDEKRQRQVPTDHEVEVIPDAGHFAFIEQPQLFNAALFRTTAPHLPPGLAAKLIRQEQEDLKNKQQQLAAEAEQRWRLEKLQELQRQQWEQQQLKTER